MITQQATMIAYIDDFRLMLYLTLLVIPLLLLIRPPPPLGASTVDGHTVMD
jgi:DHA2 family multidrug resistance protein